MPQIGTPENPLRVAIVGAGPSGFYAAEHILKDGDVHAQVDLFDRLPTPFGLVRGGVAPDHPKIKSVIRVYEKTAARDGFRIATVRHEGRVVGFAWGYTGERGQWWSDRVASTLPDEARSWVGGHFELVELAVLPEFRGRGLGRALLRAVTDVPHERLLLQTSEAADDPARRLYASEGWRVLGPGVGEGTVVLGRSRSAA